MSTTSTSLDAVEMQRRKLEFAPRDGEWDEDGATCIIIVTNTRINLIVVDKLDSGTEETRARLNRVQLLVWPHTHSDSKSNSETTTATKRK
jgi:hypothetical protein